jgi:hypothetical protein
LRELEGVLSRRESDCLGLLVSSEGFSRNALQYSESSKMAIILVHLSDKVVMGGGGGDGKKEDEEVGDGGLIRDFKMNSSAKRILPHLDYAIVRTTATSNKNNSNHPLHISSSDLPHIQRQQSSHRMVLLWKNRVLYNQHGKMS